MVTSGRELLLGMIRDPQFGPLIMVGLGGIYVEVLKDTVARLAPLSVAEATTMLDELRMAPLLRGVRGEAPVDRMAIAEIMCRDGHELFSFSSLWLLMHVDLLHLTPRRLPGTRPRRLEPRRHARCGPRRPRGARASNDAIAEILSSRTARQNDGLCECGRGECA